MWKLCFPTTGEGSASSSPEVVSTEILQPSHGNGKPLCSRSFQGYKVYLPFKEKFNKGDGAIKTPLSPFLSGLFMNRIENDPHSYNLGSICRRRLGRRAQRTTTL